MRQSGYRVPVMLEPQPEGGFTVTSPVIPELLTEGDTVDEALENVKDAFVAVLEIYEDEGRPLPLAAIEDVRSQSITTERLVAVG